MDAAKRSRHVVPGLVLLAMAAFATWNLVNNGDWTDPVIPLVGALAVVWWAGGLGLMTGTVAGVWLGRLGACVLLAVGIYLGWDNIVDYSGPASWRANAFLIVVPLTALLVGAAIGILIAVRPRADRDPAAGHASGPASR